MWKTVKLGDVCKIVNGSTPSRKEDTFWEDGDISWFTIDDMREQGRDIFTTAQHVTQRAVEEKKVKLVPENSVLLCCTASIGEAAIARKAMATNQQFNSLTPLKNDLSCEYLYYVATTLKDKLLRVSGSTTISFVSMGKLKEVEIQLPPLAEQQRIVAKLDAAFAEIDKAIESVLHKEQAISDLLSKAIKSKFEYDYNMTPKKFSEVCTLQRGYDLPTRERRKGKYPLFSANGITDYIDEYKVTAPAVITGRSGTIGEVHYTESHNWALNTALYVKDFKGNLPKYIYYFLRSFNLNRFASGAGVPTLNRNVLSEEKVYINDSTDVQAEQCNQLDNLTDLSLKFSRVQNDLISEYNLLKAAILAQELQQPQSEAA